jgi:hypothetical protein
MAAYRLPILLDIDYMRTILNIDNQTKVKAQIKSQTTQFLNLIDSPSVINTLNDEILSKKQIFYPMPAD